MYFSAVVYYSKIHNGWVIVTLNFTRTKSMESDGCINDGTRWWMKIFEQLKVCRIFWKKKTRNWKVLTQDYIWGLYFKRRKAFALTSVMHIQLNKIM